MAPVHRTPLRSGLSRATMTHRTHRRMSTHSDRWAPRCHVDATVSRRPASVRDAGRRTLFVTASLGLGQVQDPSRLFPSPTFSPTTGRSHAQWYAQKRYKPGSLSVKRHFLRGDSARLLRRAIAAAIVLGEHGNLPGAHCFDSPQDLTGLSGTRIKDPMCGPLELSRPKPETSRTLSATRLTVHPEPAVRRPRASQG